MKAIKNKQQHLGQCVILEKFLIKNNSKIASEKHSTLH